MTKLFQVVLETGLHVDGSNDDLIGSDYGYIWECPYHGPFDVQKFMALAYLILGDVFRGFELRFNATGQVDFPNLVVIYLDATYEE